MTEEILLETHPTRLAHIRLYATAAALILLGTFIYINPLGLDLSILSGYRILVLILPAIGVIITAVAEVMIRIETYTITNHRIRVKRGLLNIHESSITWERVGDIEYYQNLLEQVLDIGTLEIQGVGGDAEPDAVLRNVRHPQEIKEILMKRMFESDDTLSEATV